MARVDPCRNRATGKGAGIAPKPARPARSGEALPDAAGKPFAPAIHPGSPVGIVRDLRESGRKAVAPIPPDAVQQNPRITGADVRARRSAFAIRGA